MSPKKLTELDKQEILRLYRETRETTSTLAELFDVSNTTIGRILKIHLSESEYEYLVQQKRLGRTNKSGNQLELAIPAPAEVPVAPAPTRVAAPSLVRAPLVEEKVEAAAADGAEDPESVDVLALNEMLGEDLPDLNAEEDEDLEDEEDEDWDEESEAAAARSLTVVSSVQVLPLAAAAFPKTCYLVIDRAAELIARPLKEFADLGKIPAAEVQQKTLPVFDSHRVARRFSNRFQRVIKVPDSGLLHKTSGYLRAKGITRILMDGQIYSLS
jgi:transposase-like protein